MTLEREGRRVCRDDHTDTPPRRTESTARVEGTEWLCRTHGLTIIRFRDATASPSPHLQPILLEGLTSRRVLGSLSTVLVRPGPVGSLLLCRVGKPEHSPCVRNLSFFKFGSTMTTSCLSERESSLSYQYTKLYLTVFSYRLFCVTK